MSHQTRYMIGFVLSLICTFGAYFVVTEQLAAMQLIVPIIIALATVQLFVQMFFFLHLADEARPRWKLITFGFMAGTLLIIVFGSLWIMNNLDYHMQQMTPVETDSYLRQQSDKGF